MAFDIRLADLDSKAVQHLLAMHLSGMQQNSPAKSVYALDLSGLKSPEISVWSAWEGEILVGIGALKALPDNSGEIKSMRTAPQHLRKGVALSILNHVITEAKRRGYHRLSLETGSGDEFESALNLYRKRGFVSGMAFGDYEASSFNQFLHLEL